MMVIDIYDNAINHLGVIDAFEEASCRLSWMEVGEFSLTLNQNMLYSDLLVRGNILMFDNDRYKCGKITTTMKEEGPDGKGSQRLSVTGYELKGMFAQRTFQQLNSDTLYYLSGPAETVIKTAISDQCGPTAVDANRRFPNLVIAPDFGRGQTYVLNCKYTNLLDELKLCATQSNVGWFCYLDLENKTVVLDCSIGIDRSTAQSENSFVVFSSDRDTLRNGQLTDDESSYRNLIYVGGSGSGRSRVILEGFSSSIPSGWERFELFDDVSQLSTVAELQAEAVSMLTQYNQTRTIDGQGLVYSPIKKGHDFFLGDIVDVVVGDLTSARAIIEVQESWKSGDYSIDYTWGKIAPTSSSQIGTLAQQAIAANGNSEAGSNANSVKMGVNDWDVSNGYTADIADCVNSIIVLNGTLLTNVNVVLYFNPSTGKGSKRYTVVCKAVADPSLGATSWPHILLMTSVSGADKVNIPIPPTAFTIESDTLTFDVIVDAEGNVTSSYFKLCGNGSGGEFVLDSTGGMEQFGSVTFSTLSIATVHGAIYRTSTSFGGNQFPIPFYGDLPDAGITELKKSVSPSWPAINSVCTMSNFGTVFAFSAVNTAEVTGYSWRAIGRWK